VAKNLKCTVKTGIKKQKNLTMNYDYEEVKNARPKVMCECGKIRWVENPFCGCKPLLKIDREKRTVTETNIFNENELWLKRIGF